jgi:RNA polymerase sigma factor (sigma-70 family)
MADFPWSQEFLDLFKVGNSAVLEKVYCWHADEVARIARCFLGRNGQGEDVADLVQEVFARAFAPEARNACDPSRRFGAYVGALARNLLIDWARKRKREVAVDDPNSLLFDPTDDVVTTTVEPDALEVIARSVARLPVELRDVYQQRFVERRPQRTVRAALGISRPQLRTREKRLLDALRREMRRSGRSISEERA